MTDTPTGGNTGEVPPTSQPGGTSTPPVDGQTPAPQPGGDTNREEMIPRPRFDEVNQRAQDLEAENARLKAEQSQPKPNGTQPTSWEQVPDTTISAILSDPYNPQYKPYYQAAMQEDRRRIVAMATQGASSAMTLDQLKSREAEAFTPGTPIYREVQKIIDPKRSTSDYMADAIELARLRLKTPTPSPVPGNTLAENMRNALQTPPGGTGANTPPPPNWGTMSDEEFLAQKTKMQHERIVAGR